MNPPEKPAQRQTLKGARLRKHSDFQRAYAAARKHQSASMSWFLAPQPEQAPPSTQAQSTQDRRAPEHSGVRIGLTAGRVLGKAHERNRIKRRMREALRRHVELLPRGSDLIFHPRRAVLTMDFTKLEAEIVRILEQANAEVRRSAAPAEGTRRPAPRPQG
jgi:ribonuclease P protein component